MYHDIPVEDLLMGFQGTYVFISSVHVLLDFVGNNLVQKRSMDFYTLSSSQNVPQAIAVLAMFPKCDLQTCS